MSAKTRELFIEIRCEELPARFVERAISGLEKAVKGLLKGIEHGALTTWATPRRIAVSVADVAEGKPVEDKLVTGPPARAAFRDGKPTKAAMGFARGRGVSVDDLEVVDGPRGEVVAARVRTGGEKTVALVASGLEAAVLGIDFQKTMRWSNGRWARPIHGVIALYDGVVIDCSVAGITASNTTLGHRLTPGPVAVSGAANYVDNLRAHHVLADRKARRSEIEAQLARASAALGAEVGSIELVDEVVDLVEWPSVVTAEFEAELLELPPRLLVESMGVHQRVFPLFIDGALTNRFLVITNHPYAASDADCAAIIAKGNTKVLAARFHDAKFFYAEDRKQSLEAHGTELTGMQWIRKAGTMAEKAARLSAVARELARYTGADAEVAARAGLILVDTKYEFGKADGEIFLIDEVHTPDSSRYFYLEGYQERQDKGEKQKQLSKEFVRQWLIENGFQGKDGQAIPEMTPEFVATVSERYIELFEKITGKGFVKGDVASLEERVEKNVSQYLAG